MTQSGAYKKSAGQLLKEARENKGLSLMTVHEMTKIPLDVLKAIEEGYTVRTLSSFYLRGFVKMYAQYLDVDLHDVLDAPVPERPEPKPVAPPPKKVLPPKEVDVDVFLTKERQRQIFQGIVLLLVLFGIVKIGGCLLKKGRQPKTPAKAVAVGAAVDAGRGAAPVPKARPAETAPAQSAASTPESKAAVEKTVAVTPEKPVPEAKKAAEGVRLTVRMRKGGWLQVKVDDKIVLQSTVREGAVETWKAEREIELSGRIVHDLEFELNGKILGSLGRADGSVRKVVITKDGLSVKN